MNFSFTLSGSRRVDGDEAEKIFNHVMNCRLPTSNFWVYWNDSSEHSTITVTLRTISAKFEIVGASAKYTSSLVSQFVELKHHNYDDDTKIIYKKMVDACDNYEDESND